MSHAPNKPSSEEILHRAVMRANRAMFTISMQVRRIGSVEPEDREFLGRRIADFEFLVVAATRLRRAASIAKNAPETRTQISDALLKFDRSLPGLKKVRDIAEHIDAYSIDQGKDKSIDRRYLENFAVTGGGRTWTWLGESIHIGDLLSATAELFQALKCALHRVEHRQTDPG